MEFVMLDLIRIGTYIKIQPTKIIQFQLHPILNFLNKLEL